MQEDSFFVRAEAAGTVVAYYGVEGLIVLLVALEVKDDY